MKKLLYATCFLPLFLACKTDKPTAPTKDVVAANVDTTVSPADDFFLFANGGWIKNNPIPASESYWGIGKLVQEDIYNKMKTVSENAAKANASKGTNEQKIGDFWATGMDTVAIEASGLSAIKPELDKIAGISDINSLLDVVAELRSYQIGTMYGLYVYQDEKNSAINSLHVSQGGLGLGERDYYFKKDERNVNIRKEYVKHVATMLKLLGDADATAQKNANAILKLESFLAEKHRTIEALRDPHANYNKMSVNDLQKLTPSVNWVNHLQKTGVRTDTLIVGQPEFFKQLDASLKTFKLDDWKAYLRFNLVSSLSPYLPKVFDVEHFNFYGKVLEGKKEQKPRWKRVLDAQEGQLGDALGQLFVKEYFSPKAKKRYEDMTEAIRTAFAENIKELDWMSPVTKERALDKLQKVTKKIGFPEKWKDFSAMTVDRSSYVRNNLNANNWWFKYQANKLNKPVDRTEWDMTPQTYNAYYNPSNNEIVMPASIFMIPGFSDEQVDDAVAYGYAAASTIGHEITHGFDDQGRQFDAEGNLKMWWTAEDSAKFAQRAQLLIAQFNEYMPVDTMHVRGEATLGENIADLGGVVLGLRAFKKTEQYKKGEKIAGYTPLQRYFLGYALGWMGHPTKERLARQLMTDVHAPAKERVNGPFVNVPEFYEAFNIPQGAKMSREPAKRTKIW
ncbi:MAG: M13 family metallopeptidase [Saprospiraceae bacterium]|nr:M13 family metallopeptidase [Saprospiraceae bacterium]